MAKAKYDNKQKGGKHYTKKQDKASEKEQKKDEASAHGADSAKQELPAAPPLSKLEQLNIPQQDIDFAVKKVNELKDKLEKFKLGVLEKFSEYILGISLLPPKKDEKDLDRVDIAVLIDDTDSKTMSKFDLREKLYSIMQNIGKDIDKNMNPEPLLLTELWQNCYDSKYDLLELIAASAPIFDKGMLASIKITTIHKNMVIKKFERYIVSYVLIGSQVRGKAEMTSDIDVFVVIDDTDVKKMTRVELRDKLRAIIISMAFEAGQVTGIKNKLSVQVYIMTDFWDYLKEANPVIFTMLRDGVPFYDRGIFMPWKQLLMMGRVKPSQEAIDMYIDTGKQIIERIKFKIRDICIEDLYYAVLTPSQAALMLYGVNPPTHKEAAEVMRAVFVKKAKLLEESYVKILEEIILIRKEIEHGTKKEDSLTGSDVDRLLVDTEKFLKRLNKLFDQIREQKEEESIVQNYDNIITVIRDVLRLEGVEKIRDADIITIFESEAVHKGIIPQKYLTTLKRVVKAKKDYEHGKLAKHEVQEVQKHGKELLKFMIEYMQRKRGVELEKTKIRVKHGEKYGEVILLGNEAFIIHDVDDESKDISRGDVTPEGAIKNVRKSSLEELEKALTRLEIFPKVFVKERIFENLKEIFGRDVEILVNY